MYAILSCLKLSWCEMNLFWEGEIQTEIETSKPKHYHELWRCTFLNSKGLMITCHRHLPGDLHTWQCMIFWWFCVWCNEVLYLHKWGIIKLKSNKWELIKREWLMYENGNNIISIIERYSQLHFSALCQSVWTVDYEERSEDSKT